MFLRCFGGLLAVILILLTALALVSIFMSYFYAYSALSSRGLFKVVDLGFGSVEYFNILTE